MKKIANSSQYMVDRKRIGVFLFAFLLFTVYCLLPTSVFAQDPTPYTLLEPLPTVNSGGETTTASQYISGLFTLAIGVAGVLAVLMIIFGGIKYMSTDAFSGKNEAKDTISNALWGLALAMGAWMILNTINPDLVGFDLRLERQQLPAPSGGTGGGGGGGGGVRPGYALTPQQVTQDQAIRQRLSQNTPAVSVNSAPCTTGGTSGCTNVVGLPEQAIAGVLNLASNCNCSVTITGGTEGGHVTHGQNIPVLDLTKSSAGLNTYIQGGEVVNPPSASCSRLGTQYRRNGAIYVDEGDHWHVCY